MSLIAFLNIMQAFGMAVGAWLIVFLLLWHLKLTLDTWRRGRAVDALQARTLRYLEGVEKNAHL